MLVRGAVIMTSGIVLESRGSREIVGSAVYGTAWFDLFVFLIGVNLVVAVIHRIPIRRHLWPFAVTRFAIGRNTAKRPVAGSLTERDAMEI